MITAMRFAKMLLFCCRLRGLVEKEYIQVRHKCQYERTSQILQIDNQNFQSPVTDLLEESSSCTGPGGRNVCSNRNSPCTAKTATVRTSQFSVASAPTVPVDNFSVRRVLPIGIYVALGV